MILDLERPATLLKYVLTLDLKQCDIAVCIASGDPDDKEYTFRRVNQSQALAQRFREAVEDPVVGILIRSRIGLNVYGTNTELERLKLGPCAAAETLEVAFAFRCELCPQEYALTVASHDPDGLWHDWLEDAVAFSVTDTRYTAGVANLRAQVSFSRLD